MGEFMFEMVVSNVNDVNKNGVPARLKANQAEATPEGKNEPDDEILPAYEEEKEPDERINRQYTAREPVEIEVDSGLNNDLNIVINE